jgi:hypothetical protein
MALDPKDYCATVKARAGKLYPDLVNALALKNLPREIAETEGWPTYYMPEPCQFGHVASRFTKNSQCVDCWRVKQGRPVLYPTAKDRTYYKQRDPAPAGGAPVVVAPAAPPEPTKREIEFLSALDSSRDFDAAAAQVGWPRGLVEARASSNEVFRKALNDLCERRSIAWTRAPDPNAFSWSPEIEHQLVRRYVDTGLLEAARQELKIPASEYHMRVAASPGFAAAIEQARPLARSTLKDRATQAAERGNERLLKLLEEDAETDAVSRMTPDQVTAELERCLQKMDHYGLVSWVESARALRDKRTGAIIQAAYLEVVDSDSSPAADDLTEDLTS